MCIIDMSNDVYISDADSAREFLRAHGVEDHHHEEFACYMRFGDVVDIEYELDELREQRKADERYQDGLYTALVAAMNLADELGRKARTKEARELLREVYESIYRSEVI